MGASGQGSVCMVPTGQALSLVESTERTHKQASEGINESGSTRE